MGLGSLRVCKEVGRVALTASTDHSSHLLPAGASGSLGRMLACPCRVSMDLMLLVQAGHICAASHDCTCLYLQADDDLYDDFGLDGRDEPMRQHSTESPAGPARTPSLQAAASGAPATRDTRGRSSELPTLQASALENAEDLNVDQAVQAIGRAFGLLSGTKDTVMPGVAAAAVRELLMEHERCKQQLCADQKKQLSVHIQVRSPACPSGCISVWVHTPAHGFVHPQVHGIAAFELGQEAEQ